MVIGLLGCPSIDRTPVEITTVNVVGTAPLIHFTLEVHGRGFGLGEVEYRAGQSAGSAGRASELGFRLSNSAGWEKTFGRSALDVLSPRRLNARVQLSRPLPAGRYTFDLLRESATGKEVLATRNDAFEIGPSADAGVPDADPPDTVVTPPDDAGPDAGLPDAAPPVPDLGPFIAAFAYRMPVLVTATVSVPAGTTVRIPLNHAALVAAGKARTDGADVVVAQGSQILDFAWDDTAAVNTDDAALIVALTRALPPGGDPAHPLVLYYGDPRAAFVPTDAVFAFVERFDVDIDNMGWVIAQWFHCNEQYPMPPLDPAVKEANAYCIYDDKLDLLRTTLSTPPVHLARSPGPGLVYEMSFVLAATQRANSRDILYLAHFSTNDGFDRTVQFPRSAFDPQTLVPTDTLTFEDTDNSPRTVNGWRFPATFTGWSRVRLMFRPAFEPLVSFHLRFVSPSEASGRFVAVDEWWVRLRARSVQVAVGPEEARMSP